MNMLNEYYRPSPEDVEICVMYLEIFRGFREDFRAVDLRKQGFPGMRRAFGILRIFLKRFLPSPADAARMASRYCWVATEGSRGSACTAERSFARKGARLSSLPVLLHSPAKGPSVWSETIVFVRVRTLEVYGV